MAPKCFAPRPTKRRHNGRRRKIAPYTGKDSCARLGCAVQLFFRTLQSFNVRRSKERVGAKRFYARTQKGSVIR